MVLHCTASRSCPLLSILRQELGLSSGLVKRLKYDGAFQVNGTVARTNHPVIPGDMITVTLQDSAPEYPAEDFPIQVLYEDEAILAVDKPSGLIIHPSAARNTGTLANRVLGYYQRTGQACAFHPLTRLDRDTFGVVLLAKNAHIHARLCQSLQAGLVEKNYRAAVFGAPQAPSGVIDAPLLRPDPRKMQRAVGAGGRQARTEYRVLDRSGCESLLQLHPLTGRTHQLRLHCLHAGFPILGDPQYYTHASMQYSLKLGLQTQLLCACSIQFPHPLTGQWVQIESLQAGLLWENRQK